MVFGFSESSWISIHLRPAIVTGVSIQCMETIANNNAPERHRAEQKETKASLLNNWPTNMPLYNSRFLVEFDKVLGLNDMDVLSVDRPKLTITPLIVPRGGYPDYDAEEWFTDGLNDDFEDEEPENEAEDKEPSEPQYNQIMQWEPMKITLMELEGRPNMGILMEYLQSTWNTYRKPVITTKVHNLDPTGEVVSTWIIVGIISAVDTSELRCSDNRTQTISITIEPDYCEIIQK